MNDNTKLKIGSIVKIQTDAVHQESQKPLDGMHGSVYYADSEMDEYIVSVAELNGVQLPFSKAELVIVDNNYALLGSM